VAARRAVEQDDPSLVVPVSGHELEENGLLWLANRALHPFGYALTLSADLMTPDELMAVRTDDPSGFEFAPSLEQEGRQRFRAFLDSRRR
jgi:hypothetical protein